MSHPRSNWAGSHRYQAARLHRPETLEQLQECVSRSPRLKALGTRHSFSDIADTPGDQISLEHFDQVLELDRQRQTVTVGAGIRYGELSRWLHREGFALHNLASLPHISVAGACATATHGSGDGNGNLATAVAGLELVTASGERVSFTRADPQLAGAVVGLGGLGIITQLTLEVLPAVEMQQDVYVDLPLESLADNFDEITASAYSVSLFTDWRLPGFRQLWLKRQVMDTESLAAEPVWFGARLADRPLHPIENLSAENCTQQLGVPGAWHERLPHFRLEFTPSSGEELQSEYIFPRQHAVAALQAVYALRDRVAPVLQVSEVRTVAADHLWMSPCYEQACVAIHFTWIKDWPQVSQVLPRLEEQLAPFSACPHWGKLFTMSPQDVQSLYPRLADFQDLLQQHDPQGKFRNAFLERFLFT